MTPELLPFNYNNNYFIANISADLFINISVSFLILIFSFFSKIINTVELSLFILSIVVVFIIQYLFPTSSYMADQIPYTNFVRDIRTGITPDTGHISLYSSYIYSLFPLATPSSVISFGMYNKILFIITFIFLKKYRYINTNNLIVLILFPSLLLYSSLALREMLVLTTMILWLLCILNRKYLFSIIFVCFFLLIKTYNFYIFGIFTFLHFVYYNSLIYKSKRFLIVIILFFILPSFLIFQDLIFYEINKYIKNFYLDNFYNSGNTNIESQNIIIDVSNLLIPQINNIFDLIFAIFKGMYKVFIVDLTFSIQNKFRFIQSIENLLILISIIYFISKNFHNAKLDFIFWIFFLVLIIGMLGFMVPNFGTISRWKYSFIVIFLLAIWGILNKNNILKKKGS